MLAASADTFQNRPIPGVLPVKDEDWLPDLVGRSETVREHPKPPRNTLLRQARLRLLSPSGSGQQMSRQELAEAINAYLWTAHEIDGRLDETDIGKLERGEHRWPRAPRREAFRAVLGAAVDSELGFYPNRRTPAATTRPRLGPPEAAIGHDGTDLLPQEQRGVSGDEGDAVRRRSLLTNGSVAVADAVLSAPTRVLQALNVLIADGAGDLDTAVDSLDELVAHYSHTVCTLAPANVYDDLLSVRTHAGWLLSRAGRSVRRRSDIIVATGWLSNLLAVATSYMGDPAAAVVWCRDAERRSQEAGHPDLAGWAVLTKAMIAYYQGQARRSIALARQGQQVAPIGTVAHAKLAAQEMRAHAMHADADAMMGAKHRAAKAMAKLPSDVAKTGAFSIAQDEDPPYTATSLLLVNRFDQAVSATNRVIDTAYRPEVRSRGAQSSNYARTLLILGLAQAGLRRADEAANAGQAALDSAGVVWPTLVLAGRLDHVLTRDFPDAAETADYHARYVDAASRTLDGPPLAAPTRTLDERRRPQSRPDR